MTFFSLSLSSCHKDCVFSRLSLVCYCCWFFFYSSVNKNSAISLGRGSEANVNICVDCKTHDPCGFVVCWLHLVFLVGRINFEQKSDSNDGCKSVGQAKYTNILLSRKIQFSSNFDLVSYV